MLTWPVFLPESPRWLVTKGRTDEAVKQFLAIAKVNGVELDEKMTKESVQSLVEGDEKLESNESFSDIVHYPRVLVRFLSVCLIK